jgi:hypothetical protein
MTKNKQTIQTYLSQRPVSQHFQQQQQQQQQQPPPPPPPPPPPQYAPRNAPSPLPLTPAQQKLAAALGWNQNTQESKLKTDFKKSAMRLHPDKGGQQQDMKTLNSLYGKIKLFHGWN